MNRRNLGVGLTALALILVTAGPAAFAASAPQGLSLKAGSTHTSNGPARASLSVASPKNTPKMGMSSGAGAPARRSVGALASRTQAAPTKGRAFTQSLAAH